MTEHVLPFYVVCDESLSMLDHIDALNVGLTELHRVIETDPLMASRARMCLIGFSGSAEIRQPLSPPDEIAEIAGLSARASSNFGAAFTLLRNTIERDVDRLAGQSHRVHPPVVFFLSDGQPTDPATWPAAHAALTDPAWSARPNLIAFGIGDADPATITRIGTFRAYLGRDGVSPARALRWFAGELTTSTVSLP